MKIKIGLYIVKSEKKMQPSTFHAFIYIQNSSAFFCNSLFKYGKQFTELRMATMKKMLTKCSNII